MKGAAATLLLCLPTLAHAEGTASRDFSFFSSFLQMIAALAVVIGLILLTRHFSGKLMGGSAAGGFPAKHIRVVETRYLAPKKSLVLVEIAGEYLLLASTEEGISFIKQVHMIEEIEVIEEPGRIRAGLAGMFRRDTGR